MSFPSYPTIDSDEDLDPVLNANVELEIHDNKLASPSHFPRYIMEHDPQQQDPKQLRPQHYPPVESYAAISELTSNIWGPVSYPPDNNPLIPNTATVRLKSLPIERRRHLMAILKWNTSVSEGILCALERIDAPWTKQNILYEYLVFLNDLILTIQKVPIVLADIADCNIKLDALQAKISQLSPTSEIRQRTQDKTEGFRGLSMFHNAQQVAIFGGNFTIACPRAVEEGDATSPDD
ncbi:hypothetical protein CPC08DRAFT_767295 [Agrocybe pediades]|nr:hypothetical protein CPC08DRAFT_767295 [Agrocybe pediades]